MPQILRSVALRNRAIPAAGETANINLPVNPLSAIVITIKALNSTAALADYTAFAGLLTKFSNLVVRYRGASIIQGDPLDLAVLAAIRQKWRPKQGQVNASNGNTRSITIPLIFGDRAYDPDMCFPATRAGDLVLEWTAGADATGLSTYLLAVETVELLDAEPKSFRKATSTSRVMTAGLTNTIDLPIGNKILGTLIRSQTVPDAALRQSSFAETSLLVDNVQVGYSPTLWESLQGEMGRVLEHGWDYLEHTHIENAAAAYTQNAVTLPAIQDTTPVQAYGWLDLDPLMDQQFALDTRGAARVNLSVNSDVADATASRVVTLEHVDIAQAAAA